MMTDNSSVVTFLTSRRDCVAFTLPANMTDLDLNKASYSVDLGQLHPWKAEHCGQSVKPLTSGDSYRVVLALGLRYDMLNFWKTQG